MLGIEVVFTEKVPVIGDKCDIMLVDFSRYVIGLRREMTLDKTGHLLFDADETASAASSGPTAWAGGTHP